MGIKEELKLELICAHFNHCLREEANNDEEFVKRVCRELNIQFISEKREVKKFYKGDSLEQTARQLRFDFFLALARQFKIKKVALAHNYDDVVETVLMRIIRGTALRGLRGILPKSKYKGVLFIRPMIELDKKSILRWLKEHNFNYTIDKTNFEEVFLRNKIRNKLIPFLKEFNPNIVEALYNLSKVSAVDYEFIYNFSFQQFNSLKKTGLGFVKLDLTRLTQFPLAVVREVLRIAIEELKGNTRRLEFKHIDAILELIYSSKEENALYLPFLEVKKEGKFLIIKIKNFSYS
ncbi:MAG: tRNA lysidine(34) synthetase TilS [Candidatus Omnitrophica bacterium]|nr:tRNA lysidine(34) synthetase TilS [Candidatus Omnitrophota bacterium]